MKLKASGVPFDPHISMRSLVFISALMGLDARREKALHSVIANALLAHWRGTFCFYPRDHNAFCNADVPTWYTRSVLIDVVDRLCCEGLLSGNKTTPHPQATLRSSFCVSPALERLAATIELRDMARAPGVPVLIRDRRTRKPVMTGNRGGDLVQLARDVVEQNGALQSIRLELPKGKYPRDRGLFLADNTLVVPLRQTLQRIFSNDLSLGGRFYGGWWQNIRKRVRADLLIDGEPVVEHDYAACQLRLMYALLGLPDPLGGAVRRADLDLFARAGEDRAAMKSAVVIGINAANANAAVAALAEKFVEENLASPSRAIAEAKRIFALVQSHFPELRPLWFTDIGLRLQRLDSDICAFVQRRLRQQGIAVLSIHDSFICRRQDEGRLIDAMLEGMAAGLRQAKQLETSTYASATSL